MEAHGSVVIGFGCGAKVSIQIIPKEDTSPVHLSVSRAEIVGNVGRRQKWQKIYVSISSLEKSEELRLRN